MSTKSTPPPDQTDVEARFSELLDYGEIKVLAGWVGVPYDSLNKQLNPNNPAKVSDFYRAIRLLWGLKQIDEAKAWKAINLLTELIFPTADALQLASRIENDARRLREKLAEGAR
jgi:hypothetical protein